MPERTAYPPDLVAEFAGLKARTLALLDAALAGRPDRAALIDHLHRLGGAAGLFGESAVGAGAKALGERIEAAASVPGPDAYAPLAGLIRAS